MSGLVVVASVVMGVVGALRTGLSWDEPYHVMRLRNYLDHGWFALDWSVGSAGSASGEDNTLVYGPVAMLLLHGLSALVGVEGWGTVATTPAAYDVRHLGVLLIGLVGVAAAATTTRILLQSWQWALFTAAALLALPMWTGHLMFNVKDVPVATGYTLMTLALVSMVAPRPSQALLRTGGLAAGITLMVGTRPAMVAAVIAGLAVLWAGAALTGRTATTRRTVTESVAGVMLAFGVLLLSYPNVFAHPVSLLESVAKSTNFRDGRSAVFGYVPFHVATQVPLLLLAGGLVGLVTALAFIRRRWREDTPRATRLALVAVQLCALPLVAFARNSDLYNGLRQLLFATPAWAVLVAVGLARILTWARTPGRTRVAGGLAALGLVAPTFVQAMLFPYQYAYFNVALDATGVHVASDYWRTSVPEMLPSIPTDGQIVCGPTRTGPENDAPAMTAGRYSSDSSVDCRTDPLGPLSSAWTAESLPLDKALPRNEFYVIIDRDHAVPENCRRLAGVDRMRHGRTITMTYVARCRLEPSPLGASTVAFERLATEPNMLPELWAYAPEGWVMRDSSSAIDALGRSASLTFRAPSSCAREACDLVLSADAPADLTATVNDTPVEIEQVRDTRTVIVRLPVGSDEAWVTFERLSAEPLDLRINSIRVVPVQTNSS